MTTKPGELFEVKQEEHSKTEAGNTRADNPSTIDQKRDPCDPKRNPIVDPLSPYLKSIQYGYETAKDNHATLTPFDGHAMSIRMEEEDPDPVQKGLNDYEGFNQQKLTYMYGYMTKLPPNPTAEDIRISKGINDVPKLTYPRKVRGADMASKTGAGGFNGWDRLRMIPEYYNKSYILD